MHPPPINLLTLVLVPCVFSQGLMLRGSEVLTKVIFWLENSVYIFELFLFIGKIELFLLETFREF